jgi:hypothetical protein
MTAKVQRFELGTELRDKVTGFTGIAMTRVEFLNGCIQYGLKPKVNDKEPHKMTETIHIDVAQLELVKHEKVDVKKPAKAPGGDMPDCPKGL